MLSATSISLYTTTAASLSKKGADASVQDIAKGAVNILETDTSDSASEKAANYIKGKTQSPDKQAKVLEEIRKALVAKGEYEQNSIDTTIADIRGKLNPSGASKPAKVTAASSSKGETTAKVVSVSKTGAFGGDGSPQVSIAVQIDNLPAGAHTLSGFIRTNQDWPAGVAMTNGKTSGTFKFQAYLSPGNQNSPFYIKVADKNGNEIGRIPEGEYETLKVPFPR
jgi:hypothetical protein